ncbi:HECT-type E3 ubiquitin transferase [Malassezia nana]|uniref:HECT-type E3 ubiquitin transferase n=1 Tax=Malassezia nana TaxID=180528 RepID=A0AAF0EM39_9BASI|nr:HECT-type E3 ubiquitin transferase [Malassezia nana]
MRERPRRRGDALLAGSLSPPLESTQRQQRAKMKITKAPRRKPEVPADLAAWGARLLEAPESELAGLLTSVEQWVWPRGDLYSWVAVLNRLDDILARICQETPLRPIQTAPFTPANRALLLAILSFARLLLENCMNRKLYASYEHLDTLLSTDDGEVLEALLYLLLRPAQQHAGSARHELAVDHARLAVLASAWPPRDHGIELADAAQEAAPYPPGLHAVQVHCRQRRAPAASGPATPGRPTQDEPSDWITVHHLDTEARSPGAIVQAADPDDRLTDEERFELFHKVRVALAYRAWPSRQQAIVCRLLAMACFAHTVPESMANAHLFMVEPSLVPRTAALLEPTAHTGYWVQSAALYALDSVGHFRLRLGELLTAVNASVSHGLLLQILLQTQEALQASAEAPTPPLHTHMDAFVDALMTLVANLTTTVSGSTMVVSAGLIPQLLELACIVSHTNALVQRTSARAIGLIDSLVYSYPPAFEQLTAARGLDVLVTRTVQCVDDAVARNMPLSFGAANVLRQLLRLFHHLMSTTGLADGLRNLIDTPLVPALRTIMEHRTLFGTQALAQAITIMAAFVHNEPTQLVTIQEHKLPEAFLGVIQDDLEPSFELLNALTTAIGALCLNEAGLRDMTSRPMVPRVLRVLTDARYHRVLLDRDNANIFGTAVDELVRHHPSLKEGVQTELVRLLDELVASGAAFTPPTEPAARALYALPPDEVPLQPQPISTTELVLEEPDQAVPEAVPGDANAPVASFDVVCRFLEGFFRNASLSRDFVRSGSLSRLLAFLSTPCLPYHFGTSSPADSLVMLLRTMVEESPSAVLSALLQEVYRSLHEMAPPMLALWEPNSDVQARLRAWVRLHTRLHVLTDVCETLVQSFTFPHASAKVPLALFRALSEGGDVATLAQLGQLMRVLVWEHLRVKAALRGRELLPHTGAAAVQYMAVRMQASLLSLFTVLARLLTPKRHMDAEFQRASLATADALAQVLRSWEAPREDASPSDALAEQTYLCLMHAHLLYDRRPVHTTHAYTVLLQAWVARGGDAALGTQLQALVPTLAHDAPTADETSVGAHAVLTLRAYLDLYTRLLQARPLLDAPQTATMARETPSAPHKLLVDLRARALDVLEPLWHAPWLSTLPMGPVRMVGQALGLILQADRETPPPQRPDPSVPAALSSALAVTLGGTPIPFPTRALPMEGPSRTSVDESRLAQLVEMGFPRGAARRALERCHNNVSAATEYVLQHPELEDEPDESNAPAEEGNTEPSEAPMPADEPTPPPAAPTTETPSEAPTVSEDALDALQAAKAALDERRAVFRPTFFPRLLELADKHEPLVFDAKQVLGAVSKDTDRVAALWEHVLGRLPSDSADPTLPTRLHFVALALTYERVQFAIPWATLPPLAQRLLGWAQAQAQSSTELPYYASVLVAISGVLGLSEAPFDQPCDTVLPSDQLTLLREARAQLLPLLLQTLSRAPQFSASALLATYRVLVLVTRDSVTAAALAEGEKLAVVLRPLLTRRFSQLASCQRLVLMVLRHVIEASGTLLSFLAYDIQLWLAQSARTRSVDILQLLKGMSYAVLRDPVTYMRAAATQLELVDGPSGRAPTHVRAQPHAQVPPLPDVAQSLCDVVMDTLLDQAQGALQGSFRPLEEESASESATTESALSEADARDAYVFFLLQAMVELLSSYMGCKHSFVRHQKGGESMLTYMLSYWVPSGFLHNYEPEELRKRMAQSNWAMSLGVALAMDPAPMPDASSVPDALIGVRKSLLDALHKAIREALLSHEAVEVRYGRLYALADLCHRLLTAQPHGGAAVKRSEVVLHLAKTMLEKNFVPLLANVLADVDLGFPSVRALLEAVLRPLEHLTKAAIKMARADRHRQRPGRPADSHGAPLREEEQDEVDGSDDDDDDDDDDMESDSLEEDGESAPDFYRNSSLGMHTGEMEHGAYDSAGELSDEEDEAEMEMEEYDSEEGSELSTDAEGLDGDSTHVVEVMEEDDSMDEHDEASDDMYDELEDEWEDEYDDGVHELDEEDVDYVIEDDGPAGDATANDNDEHGVDEILEALDDMEGGNVDLLEGDDAMDSGDDALLDTEDTAELDFGDESVWPAPRHADDRFGANWSWTQVPRPGRRHASGPPTFFGVSSPRDPTGPTTRSVPEPARLHDDDAAFHPLLADDHAAQGEGEGSVWPRSVEALMGGPTMQFLEMFLQRNVPSGADASIRIELDHGHGPPHMHITNVNGEPVRLRRESMRSRETAAGPTDVVAESHRFRPLHTNARRGEEALVLLGTAAAELGTALRTQFLHALTPQLERRRASEAQDKASATRSATDTKRKRADMEPSSTSPEVQPSRVTVSVRGADVDLTNTGIDPTFLEALPDELREEALLSQQLGARLARPARRPPMAPDFLDVLPRSLRAELQQVDEEASHDPQRASAPQENASGEAPEREQSGEGAEAPAETVPRDAIQLLDRAGMAALVRLLYFPSMQARASLLHKVLAHLSENARSRSELLTLLLLVLSDSTTSNGTVDRSFAAMSCKAARQTPQRGTPRRPATPSASGSLPPLPAPLALMGGEAPHLIASRSLETLNYLTQVNPNVAVHFLREDKTRKGGKRMPLQILLSLLEKDTLLEHASLVNALVQLLHTVTKPLVTSHEAPDGKGTVLDGAHAGVEVASIPAERLAALVKPLRTPMSSRAFQHTLAVAANLAHMPGTRDVISEALQQTATRASQTIQADLDDLIASLPPVEAPTEGPTAEGAQPAAPPPPTGPRTATSLPLAKLASPTSAQAEFLRCLRALDYLYVGK